jgi:hypothetical protein
MHLRALTLPLDRHVGLESVTALRALTAAKRPALLDANVRARRADRAQQDERRAR